MKSNDLFITFCYNEFMEIVKYIKKKRNIYELVLDNNTSINLYDDVIIKYNLLVNKTIDNKLITEITNYNDSLNAYYLSINFINKKLRSELEIKKYLEKKEINNKTINDTISKLQKDGYLNHKTYVVSYINDAYNFSNYGPDRIKYNLNKLGFSDDEIIPYLNKDFISKVQNIIDKKVKVNHKLSTNALKLSLSNYLINLGYPKEIFISYLDNQKTNNKNLIIKDYNLLMNKYKNKYEKEKLFYFIKDKLYKKGYNIDEINEVISNELF